MNIEKIFSVCNVEVSFEDDEALPDIYAATHAAEGELKLEAVRENLQRLPLETGEQVIIQSPLPDALYVMKARVVRCLVGNVVTVIVQQEGEIERIQRRRHFRVALSLPVKLEGDSLSAALDLVTEDISAGGLRVLSPEALGEGLWVRLRLDVGDGKPPIACKAQGIRCDAADGKRFYVSVKFRNMSEHDNERLTQVLMQEMRRAMNL